MRLLIAGSVLCSLLACSAPERQHETKKQQYPLRHHPNRGLPVDRWSDTEKSAEPELDSKPAQVTTRSGSLIEPGPDNSRNFNEPSTPTFAPDGASPKPARRFSSEIPQGNRAPVRSSSLSQNGSQDPNKKSTMVGWIKGLRSDKKEPEPAAEEFMPPKGATPKSANHSVTPSEEFGTSIDPRKVYRGPKPEEDIDESRYGSRFNETGVPDTGTDFQGRADSAF